MTCDRKMNIVISKQRLNWAQPLTPRYGCFFGIVEEVSLWEANFLSAMSEEHGDRKKGEAMVACPPSTFRFSGSQPNQLQLLEVYLLFVAKKLTVCWGSEPNPKTENLDLFVQPEKLFPGPTVPRMDPSMLR